MSLHDSEAVISELTQRLRERGAQKKTRATLLEGASAARLEGAHSSMMHSSMISKSMMAASKSIDKARAPRQPPRRPPRRPPRPQPLPP